MPSPPKMCFGNTLMAGKICILVVLCFENLPVTGEASLGIRSVEEYLNAVPFDELCHVAKEGECPWEYVEFWLYTRCNPSNPVKLDNCSLATAPWVAGPTKILIHGYMGNKDAQINVEIGGAYLNYENCNVVVVDWGRLCRAGCYLPAVDNMPPVAHCVSDFIKAVVAHGKVHGSDIHLLGHSLGAHVVTMTTSFCHIETGRVYNLDPALPLIKNSTMAKAPFVMVYHSNCGMLGQCKSSGHADVYFNNGVHQPGCGLDIVCSHNRVISYIAECISRRIAIRAMPCDCEQCEHDGGCVLPEPSDVNCSVHTVDVGERANPQLRGNFTAGTMPGPPYLP